MAKKKNTKSKSKVSKARTVAKSSITNVINTEVIAAALSTVNQPIFLKVCRLCETKDGPFLNIFDSEKVTAKKIEELMPFWVRLLYFWSRKFILHIKVDEFFSYYIKVALCKPKLCTLSYIVLSKIKKAAAQLFH